MRKYLWLPVVLILWVIHVDWHLARSHHYRFSMEWREHWIVGLFTFSFLCCSVLCCFVRASGPIRFVLACMGNAA